LGHNDSEKENDNDDSHNDNMVVFLKLGYLKSCIFIDDFPITHPTIGVLPF
jgi:hypothetical protein